MVAGPREPLSATTPQGRPGAGGGGRIFLSYARADDARNGLASELYTCLRAAGFEPWWDRVDMPGRGLTFLQEIRDAIDACERLVVVIGPDAVSSDYVRAEWQYALAVGKIVNPILAEGTRALLPPELGGLDCPDASRRPARRRALDHLARQLQEAVPTVGPLIGVVPEVPTHYQPRSTEVSRLADCALIDLRRPIVTRPEQRMTIVHGMPGSGKSALAAAFVRSPEVRRSFSGGLVWVRSGRTQTAREAALAVLRALGGSPSQTTRGAHPEVPLEELHRVLSDRACLVVLDDVWSLDVVLPFRDALGARSRLVVTTRQADLQTSLGCLGFAVGSLTEPAALRHLSDWTGVDVEKLPAEARAVARECGYLPFALALCGAMVRDGLRYVDLLVNLRAAKLDFLDRRLGDYPYRNFQRAMTASVDALKKERRSVVDCYLELAVFEAGSRIPVAAVARLWAAPSPRREAQVRQMLALLQGRSLLRVASDDAVELHDLQWDYLAASPTRLPALHRRLLDRYRREFPRGLHTAPAGDYIVSHAARHLEGSKQHAALIRLIDRAWFERKFTVEALRTSFLDDVGRAIGSVTAPSGKDLGTLARLAMIRSSVAQVAVDVPEEALYVLARCGRADVALDISRLAADPWRQVRYHSLVAVGCRERGDTEEARRLGHLVLELAQALPEPQGVRAWAAEHFAALGDPYATALVDGVLLARRSDEWTDGEATVRMALVAHTLGRTADARRLLSATETRSLGTRPSARDDGTEVGMVAGAWMRLGERRRARQLVHGQVRHWRAERVTRSWSPAVGLLGMFAFDCADAGHPGESARVWACCRSNDRRSSDWAWHAAEIAARLGDAGDARRYGVATGQGLRGSDRQLTVATSLANSGTALAQAGRPREARRLAQQAIALIERPMERGRSSSSPRHAALGDRSARQRVGTILSTIATTFAVTGDEARAEQLAHRVLLSSARFDWDLRNVGEAEGALAAARARQGHAGEAMRMVAAIADDYARNDGFALVAAVFAKRGDVPSLLTAVRAIDSEGYADWQRSRVVASAIPLLPVRVLSRAASCLLDEVGDGAVRSRALASMALRLPDRHLTEATRYWVTCEAQDDNGAAMVDLARAAQGRPEEAAIRGQLEAHAFQVPGATAYWRIAWIEHVAQMVVLWELRSAAARVMAAAECGDAEYSAAAFSRVALVFTEAGWSGDATRAATRAARYRVSDPLVVGDINGRLALAWHGLGMTDRSTACARRALKALVGTSSSRSAFDAPGAMRERLGVSLARIGTTDEALALIRSVAGPEPDVAAETLVGLFTALLAGRSRRTAKTLEDTIEAIGRGGTPWMRARFAAAWQAAGNHRQAVARLAAGLEASSHRSAMSTLDVIRTGAEVLESVDSGATVRAVYAALQELQSWGGGAAPPPGRDADRFVAGAASRGRPRR